MSTSPNKKILIVADEPEVVDLLTLQLRKAGGFTTITAQDGAEGLKKARTESPALMLPHISGLEDRVDACVREDVELALTLKARDKALDEMNATASRRLIERMAQDPEQLRGYLNLIFIARHLERVGDHATNIAEDAVYAAAAKDIRHQGTQAT